MICWCVHFLTTTVTYSPGCYRSWTCQTLNPSGTGLSKFRNMAHTFPVRLLLLMLLRMKDSLTLCHLFLNSLYRYTYIHNQSVAALLETNLVILSAKCWLIVFYHFLDRPCFKVHFNRSVGKILWLNSFLFRYMGMRKQAATPQYMLLYHSTLKYYWIAYNRLTL